MEQGQQKTAEEILKGMLEKYEGEPLSDDELQELKEFTQEVLEYASLEYQVKSLTSQLSALREAAIPSDETLATELIARFSGNSRGNPISKKAFIDGVLWIKERIESLLNDTGKNG